MRLPKIITLTILSILFVIIGSTVAVHSARSLDKFSPGLPNTLNLPALITATRAVTMPRANELSHSPSLGVTQMARVDFEPHLLSPITPMTRSVRSVTALEASPLDEGYQLSGFDKPGTQAYSDQLAERYPSTQPLDQGDSATPNQPLAAAAACMATTIADSGSGSLRQCLLDATPGGSITFDPSVFSPIFPGTIFLASPLPWITTDMLTINASNAGVILDGGNLVNDQTCLVIDGANQVTIRGFQVLNCPSDGIALINGTTNAVIENNLISNNTNAGILLLGNGTTNNHIQGNLIGVDPFFGLLPWSNRWGVVVVAASDNVIGGTTEATRNVISGNTSIGVSIEGVGADNNKVQGNYIGINIFGTGPLPNGVGVGVLSGAKNNEIGGTTTGTRNIISGNNDRGIGIEDAGTTDNKVLGNYIGTDTTGTIALGNVDGVLIGFGAKNNVIGGETPEARNLISGNFESGVRIQNEGTTDNKITGNHIGTNYTGGVALANGIFGVIVLGGAKNNIIGGLTAGAGNLISGNDHAGIQIEDIGTTGNQVQGNYIGTNVTGLAKLSNGNGVIIGFGAQNNLVGGARNIISGNSEAGVWIHDEEGHGTSGNQVQGNYIGLNADGAKALSNDVGIVIDSGAKNNAVGGDTAKDRNIISGNTDRGILIQGNGTNGNQVKGNYIGPDATGTTRLDNFIGIGISVGAKNNLIGGNKETSRNIISGNTVAGIQIQNNETTGNQVKGNYIGTDVTGTASLSNTQGVGIGFGAQDNLIGGNTSGAGNLISGNSDAGIKIQDAGTNGNQVQGNYIGTTAKGKTPLGNFFGIGIARGAQNNLIGGATAETRNLISGNSHVGVQIEDLGTDHNQILGNYIGTEVTGLTPLGNYAGVVIWLDAQANIVGGDALGAGNLISGNTYFGIVLQDRATNNKIQGNKIGPDITGMTRLDNDIGILIRLGATNNLVGGETEGAGNLISGNTKAGIQLQENGTSGNSIWGNYIGTTRAGTAPLGNTAGVVIGFGTDDNIVGGEGEGTRNIISGNTQSGVVIQNNGTTNNTILGNYIGTDAMGSAPIGNQWGVGIVEGARNNVVGGDTPEARNLISGNTQAGISIRDADDNQIRGNYIGTDATGMTPLGNRDGILIGSGAENNLIGGETAKDGNLISGNTAIGLCGGSGIKVEGGAEENWITGNYIGTNALGTGPLPNVKHGVYILGGSRANTIGVSNTIIYNGSAGVAIQGLETRENTITRNDIHDNQGAEIDAIDAPVPLPPSTIIYSPADETISGSVCPNCAVEIFGNFSEEPAGIDYLGAAMADGSGNFTFTRPDLSSWSFFAITITNLDGTTSGFFPVLQTLTVMNNNSTTPGQNSFAVARQESAEYCWQLFLPIILK